MKYESRCGDWYVPSLSSCENLTKELLSRQKINETWKNILQQYLLAQQQAQSSRNSLMPYCDRFAVNPPPFSGAGLIGTRQTIPLIIYLLNHRCASDTTAHTKQRGASERTNGRATAGGHRTESQGPAVVHRLSSTRPRSTGRVKTGRFHATIDLYHVSNDSNSSPSSSRSRTTDSPTVTSENGTLQPSSSSSSDSPASTSASVYTVVKYLTVICTSSRHTCNKSGRGYRSSSASFYHFWYFSLDGDRRRGWVQSAAGTSAIKVTAQDVRRHLGLANGAS